MTLREAMLRALAIGMAFLVAVWAFVSYLQPAFSGDRAGSILYCF